MASADELRLGAGVVLAGVLVVLERAAEELDEGFRTGVVERRACPLGCNTRRRIASAARSGLRFELLRETRAGVRVAGVGARRTLELRLEREGVRLTLGFGVRVAGRLVGRDARELLDRDGFGRDG